MDKRWHKCFFWGSLFVLLLAARLCHSGILWADEDYHQAAAIQLLHGKMLYRDVWYDKPPANAMTYLLFGAMDGWILRLASALYALLVCALAFRFSSALWTRGEGYWAAALFAFFLIFYFPGATITLEPDTLLLAPHLAAVYLAWRRRPLAAGMAAGIAMWFNVKAVFVLAACALFGMRTWPLVGLGFLIPAALQAGWLSWTGALTAYWEQVWRWGLLYAAATDGVGSGLSRLLNWAGFHAALVIGAAWFAWKRGPATAWWRVWCGLSILAAGAGWRFLPRYMDQLLPPLVLAASHGWADLMERAWPSAVVQTARARMIAAALCGLTLAVPAVRFGPRYVMLATERLKGAPHQWVDVAMDQDSRAAALIVRGLAKPEDSISVWGYRPNIVSYTRLSIAGRFWDSQPLTGVAADRHLSSESAIAPQWAAANRAEFIRTQPTFLADGLSLYNPRLDIHNFPDLAEWLEHYCEAGRTQGTIVYRRCEPGLRTGAAPAAGPVR